MSQIQKISSTQALILWNNFTTELLSIIPFSFNPSLFFFFEKHFGWKPYYLILTKNNKPCGILPLVNTGKVWASLPHFSYGGLLLKENYNKEITSDIIVKLIQKISTNKLNPGFYNCNINNKLSNNNNSIKTFIRTLESNNDNEYKVTNKVTSIIKLPRNNDALTKMLNSNLKRKISKAKRSEIVIRSGGLELLDDFYRIYSRNIFKLGSLNYGKKFIIDLFSTYEYGIIKIFVAYLNNLPIGSSLLAGYGGFYENMFFATAPESRKLYVSDLLHHEMINYSIENNNPSKNKTNGVYSFGRSTQGSGVHKYKGHWPIVDYPIFTYSNISDIKNQNWMLNVWGKLPYTISSPLGAKLIKHIY